MHCWQTIAESCRLLSNSAITFYSRPRGNRSLQWSWCAMFW